jgi:CRP-like cAMP-binding protein
MTEEGWQICESVLNVRTIKKGGLLLRQGSISNQVSFINHGLLRMYTTVDGRDKVTQFFKEGDYTGDYRSFLLREPANTSIQALEDTELVETKFDDLQMVYKKVPEANLIGRLVAEDLFIDICRRTSAQVSDSIEAQYNSLANEKPWLLQRVPQYMIASYLGVTPEALSRIKARAGRKVRKLELV